MNGRANLQSLCEAAKGVLCSASKRQRNQLVALASGALKATTSQPNRLRAPRLPEALAHNSVYRPDIFCDESA